MTPRCLIVAALASLLAAARADAAESFTVTGRFLYEDKEWGYAGWTGEDPELPIRRADVIVLDLATGRVLGRGATDEAGEFAVACTAKGAASALVDVLARVDSENRAWAAATKGVPRLRVQPPDGPIYSAFAPEVPGHDPSVDLDLGTTLVPAVQISGRDGNPFNVFDMGVRALELVTGPRIGSERKVPGFRVQWPNVLGSYSLGRRAWVSTDDGYDDAVILHELGHVLHNLYSDSDNPGGLHYFGDSDQDPRLSFGEGWATAFAGMVQEDMGRPALYVDARASDQLGGVQLQLDLETTGPYFEQVQGSCDEVAVACVLFDIADGSATGGDVADDDLLQAETFVAGLSPTQALWQVFTGPVKRARAVTMNHAWDGWLSALEGEAGDQSGYEALREVHESRLLRNWQDAFEPDDLPAAGSALVATTVGAWSDEHTLYRGAVAGLGPGTGDRDWFAVELSAGAPVVIETRYPGGVFDAATQADPALAVFDPQGHRSAKDDDSGEGRNASVTFVPDVTGTWRFVVHTRNSIHRYGRYEVRARLLLP